LTKKERQFWQNAYHIHKHNRKQELQLEANFTELKLTCYQGLKTALMKFHYYKTTSVVTTVS